MQNPFNSHYYGRLTLGLQQEDQIEGVMSAASERGVRVLLVEGVDPDQQFLLIPNDDVAKLPADFRGPYLWDDDRCFPISCVFDDEIHLPLMVRRKNFDQVDALTHIAGALPNQLPASDRHNDAFLGR